MAQKTKSARGQLAKKPTVKKSTESLVTKIAKKVTATVAAVTHPGKADKAGKAVTAVKASKALKEKPVAPVKTQQLEKAKKALATVAKPTVKAEPKTAKPALATKAPKAAKVTTSTMNPLNAKAQLSIKPEAKPETKGRGRKISIDVNAGEAASALSSKWATLYKKAEQIESKPYNMKAVFEEKTAIVHKVLGWGYILANRNDRLEVLFKDGIKYLISNYKP